MMTTVMYSRRNLKAKANAWTFDAKIKAIAPKAKDVNNTI